MLDPLHPSIVLLVGAAVAFVVPRRFAPAWTLAAATAGLLAVLALDRGDRAVWGFYGVELTPLRVDALSTAFATGFAVVGVLAAVYGWTIGGRMERVGGLVAAAAGIGVVLAGDLVSLFFWWEMKAVATAALVVAARRPESLAAGRRYLLVHLAGGAALLGGIVWIGAEGRGFGFDSLLVAGALDGPGALVVLGVLLNAAAWPLGAWLPDAYPRSTVLGTVLLSAFTTKSAVYVLARGFAGLEVLVWVGVVMALVGVSYAVLEHDLRRLLSFHIVSQVGFMVAAVGVGGAAGVNGATAHALAHLVYKALLLMAVGAVVVVTGRTSATRLGGLAPAMPSVVAAYLVGAFSISAMPLLAGFPAKALSTGAVADAGPWLAAWLLKAASVGTFLSVALKLPALTWFGERRGPLPERPVPGSMLVAMGLAVALNVVAGVAPGLLHGLLPYPVESGPYAAKKVVEALQLAAFTFAGFLMLRARLLRPQAKTPVDTDWVYRELPARLATLPAPRLAGAAQAARAAGSQLVTRVRPLTASVGQARASAGLVLGGTVALTCVVLLAASVLS